MNSTPESNVREIVLVHGGFVDGSGWEEVYKILKKDGYHVSIVQNPTISLAEDVAVTKRVLETQSGPVILVGHSYGGLAALLFSTEHPELVRTLTLSEAPVFPWVEEQPGDAALVRDFFRRCWLPVRRALARHEREEALAITTKYFTGSPSLPSEARDALESNLREWEALSTSDTPFPVPSTKSVKEFRAPVLLLTGDHTLPVLKRCVAALTARFPESERVVIHNATHDMWSERAQDCGVALRKFLRGNRQAH